MVRTGRPVPECGREYPRGGLKKISAALVTATMLAVALFTTKCTYSGAAFVATVSNDTPESPVAAYVSAVARGDEEQALAVWRSPDAPPPPGSGRVPPSAPATPSFVDPAWLQRAQAARERTERLVNGLRDLNLTH